MKKKNPLHPFTRWFSHNKKSLVPILAIAILGTSSLSFALSAASSGSSSPEVKFTDASRSGLAIVPASGASGPAPGVSGTVAAVSCAPNGVTGQAYNSSAPTTPPVIYFYIGSAVNGNAVIVDKVTVNPLGSQNELQFKWTIPAQYQDGQAHEIIIYAVGSNPSGSEQIPLYGPALFTCSMSCPAGDTGTYPNCTLPPGVCQAGFSGTYPNCYQTSAGGMCAAGYTGTYPNCTGPSGGVCPTGYSGSYPNCVGPSNPSGPSSGVCPTGYTGTYPSCTGPSGGVCPTGYSGTYPSCAGPTGGICPTGYSGTYPNCVGPSGTTGPSGGVCPTGYSGSYPNCTGPAGGICATGYSGTYPNCVGPSGGVCPTGYTGTYPSCVGPIVITTVTNTCPTGYSGTYPVCTGTAGGVCPTGYSGTYPSCVGPTITNTCPTGDTGVYPNCIPASGPPIGTTLQCLINDTCGLTPVGNSCGLGYTLSNGLCIFTDCPAGYILNSTQCVVNTSVTNSCTPQYVCGANGNLYHEDATCALSSSPSQVCGYGCAGNACLPPPAPVVSKFIATPTLVQKGSPTTVTWNVSNVEDCTITGSNGTVWTQPAGSTSWTGTQATAPITGQTVYTLHCSVIPGSENSDGTPAVWADQVVTVNIIPTFQEQ